MGEERDIVERLQAEVDDLRKAIRNQAETWTRGFKEAGKMPPASLRKVAAEAELSALRSRIVEVGEGFRKCSIERAYAEARFAFSEAANEGTDDRVGDAVSPFSPPTPDDFGVVRGALKMLAGSPGFGALAETAHIEDEAIAALYRLQARVVKMEAALNTPELHDFAAGVVHEAAHQRERWGVDHDVGKEPEDWFWLVGFLTGKALRAARDGDTDKALHHTISTAATLANWHAALSWTDTRMQPGHAPSVARAALETKADD